MPDTTNALIAAFFASEGKNVKDLPDSDPLKNKGIRMGNTFTDGVHFLKSTFPSPTIRTLMGHVWNIVGHKVIPVTLGPNVTGVSLAAIRKEGIVQTVIFLPHNWLEDVKRDPVFQMGALVFVGSQAVDVYNGKVTEQRESEQTVLRARAHEAEYILHIQRMAPLVQLNDYQKDVLAAFPLGLLSPAAETLLYSPRPFTPPS